MKTKNVVLIILAVFIFFSCEEKKQSKKEEVKKELKVKKEIITQEIEDPRLFTIDSIKIAAMNDIFIDCNKGQTDSGFQIIHRHCVQDTTFDIYGNFITKYDKTTNITTLESIKVKMDRKNTKYYLSKVTNKKFDPKNKIKEIVIHLTEKEDNSPKSVKINAPIEKGDILDIHIFDPKGNKLGDTKCPESLKNNLPNHLKGRTDIKYNFCASLINCK